MRKWQELIIFIVLLVFLIALPLVLLITPEPEGVTFIGNREYLRLLVNDGVFWQVIRSTYGKPLLFSILLCLVPALIKYLAKFKVMSNFFVYHGMLTLIGSITSFVFVMIAEIAYFGLPMGVYSASYLVTGTPPAVSASVIDVLIALQIGVAVSFLFWLAESVISLIKNKCRRAEESKERG